MPIALALENAIEAMLRIDSETRSRLALIEGRAVRVNMTSPTLSVMLSVSDSRVFIAHPDDANGPDPTAHTTISGSSTALRSLINGNDALYTGEVKIEGDLATGRQVKSILSLLDPDWQEALSPYLGDSLVHRLDVARSRLSHWVRRTHSSTHSNASEYLQEEVQLLAPNSEIHFFCTEVDSVRAAADRLQARLERLEKGCDTHDVEE